MEGSQTPYSLDLDFFRRQNLNLNQEWTAVRGMFLRDHPLLAMQQEQMWAEYNCPMSSAPHSCRDSVGSLETSPGLLPFPYLQEDGPDEKLPDAPTVQDLAAQNDWVAGSEGSEGDQDMVCSNEKTEVDADPGGFTPGGEEGEVQSGGDMAPARYLMYGPPGDARDLKTSPGRRVPARSNR